MISIFAIYCAGDKQDSSMDVDLATATVLIAQPAPTPASAVSQSGGGNGGGTTNPVGPAAPIDPDLIPNLFSLDPGTFVPMASMGTIDPVGTSLSNDYDGDGINNADETTSNIWVADYPVIDATIATPVTLRIEILRDTTSSSSEIVSEITAEDMEDRKTEGTEKIHRTETNERTVQYQDSYSAGEDFTTSSPFQNPLVTSALGFVGNKAGGIPSAFKLGSLAKIFSAITGSRIELRDEVDTLDTGDVQAQSILSGALKATGGLLGAFLGGGGQETWTNNNQKSATKTYWKDQPFKNNLDREAKSLKTDKATTKSRNYRSEKVTKVDENSIIEPDAGVVRAALYIKNRSVNMPVKLTNILASLMFETPDGELIPMQSFRLRNDDFSLFEVEVYGGTEFGPYVVELRDLNTVEVERAILRGYTPKIYLVDYQMQHVADSNYRNMLLNFSGENLKIIEENAKGRTSLLRVFGPNVREMFRVSAFDTDNTGDPCDGTATMVSPGVTFQKAMERVACSGMAVEFENYVVDLSGSGLDVVEDQVFIPAVKSFNGISNNIPCTPQTLTGSDGVARTACVMNPINTWTEQELTDSGFWVIFSDGRYFTHTGYEFDGSNAKITFNTPAAGVQDIPVLKGITDRIWVGDVYDLTYVRVADLLQPEFGTSPLDTGEEFDITTRWRKDTLGEYPFDPEVGIQLGQAALGEKVQITFTLNETYLLNPQFNLEDGSSTVYNQFQYGTGLSTQRYDLDEAVDFELSLGLGGERSDWLNIVRDLGLESDDTALASCGQAIDYVEQIFTLCLRLPRSHPLVTGDSRLINLYLRPALNNVYRESVWPTPYDEVRQFQAVFQDPALTGASTIKLFGAVGDIAAGDSLYIAGESSPFAVSAVAVSGEEYTITLGSPMTIDHAAGDLAYVEGALTAPQYGIFYDGSGFATWNSNVVADWQNNPNTRQDVPLATVNDNSCSTFQPTKCLGYVADFLVGNWVGNDSYSNPYWNDWADASYFGEFLSSAQRRWLLTMEEIRAQEVFGIGHKRVSTNGPNLFGNQGLETIDGTTTGLAVWKRGDNFNLTARLIDLTNGENITGEIGIGGAQTDEIATASHNGKGVVVFQESAGGGGIYHIRAHFFDGNAGISEGMVNIASGSGYNSPRVVIANGQAVISWAQGISPGTFQFAIVDLTTQTITSTHVVQSGGLFSIPEAIAVGNRVVFVYAWILDIFSPPGKLYARIFDMSSLTFTTPGPIELESYAGFATINRIRGVGAGNRAFIMTSENTGRILDLSTGTQIATNIVLTSMAASGITVGDMIVDDTSGRVFVPWYGSAPHGAYGRFVDLNTAAVEGTDHLTFQTAPDVFTGANGIDAASNGEWITVTYSTLGSLRSRFLNWSTGEMTEELVSRTIGSPEILAYSLHAPQVSMQGDRALLTWGEFRSTGFGGSVLWRYLDSRLIPLPVDTSAPLQYGLNNFFVAPLMERVYTIQAEIKD